MGVTTVLFAIILVLPKISCLQSVVPDSQLLGVFICVIAMEPSIKIGCIVV